MSSEESDTRVRAAAVRATMSTAALIAATFVPGLNFFALILFAMPLALLKKIAAIDLGSVEGDMLLHPNALGYVISSVVVWIVSYFLFWSSLPRKETPQ